jgi:hypothetical protein
MYRRTSLVITKTLEIIAPLTDQQLGVHLRFYHEESLQNIGPRRRTLDQSKRFSLPEIWLSSYLEAGQKNRIWKTIFWAPSYRIEGLKIKTSF